MPSEQLRPGENHTASTADALIKCLRTWCDLAHHFGRPIVLEYGTECNGFWMPWSARHNAPNGTQRFRAAYRHIHRQLAKATNITWVFHVNGDDNPDTAENHLENYYPGDDVVDWLAVSCYGAQFPQDVDIDMFADRMSKVYDRLEKLAPTKPVFVAEFGCIEKNPHVDPLKWTDDALGAMLRKDADKWKNLIGFSWWNSYWDNPPPQGPSNMIVQDIAGLSAVFQTNLKEPRVQVEPVVVERLGS
jgi:beta-mannanase